MRLALELFHCLDEWDDSSFLALHLVLHSWAFTFTASSLLSFRTRFAEPLL